MKNRRYFTCPIQAIYMAKEFGVMYIVGDQAHYSYKDFLDHTFNHLNRREKFYVATESEAIFDYKEGDLMQYDFNHHKNEIKTIGKASKIHFLFESYSLDQLQNKKIIMRDNKHFFMGELENETQD